MNLMIAALWAFLITLAVSQNVGDLPKCAQTCIGSSLGGCDPINIACICKNTAFISGLSCCIANACDANDQAATIKFADSLCASVGVTVPTSISCSTAGPNSTSIARATTSIGMSSGMSSAETKAGATSLRTTSVSTTVTTNGATAMTQKTSGTSKTPTSTAASTGLSSAAAGHTGLDPGVGMAGLAVAVLAML